MNTAIIWTSAACQGNPGRGGYAATATYPDGSTDKRHSGRRRTTPERMEIFAAIAGLTMLKEPHNVELRSTSNAVIDAINSRALPSYPDLEKHLLPLVSQHNTIAILQKRRTDPEHQETYALALRASQSNPNKPDTGFEQQKPTEKPKQKHKHRKTDRNNPLTSQPTPRQPDLNQHNKPGNTDRTKETRPARFPLPQKGILLASILFSADATAIVLYILLSNGLFANALTPPGQRLTDTEHPVTQEHQNLWP